MAIAGKGDLYVVIDLHYCDETRLYTAVRNTKQIKSLTPELQRVLTSWGTALLSSSRSMSWSADSPEVKGQHHAQAAAPPA